MAKRDFPLNIDRRRLLATGAAAGGGMAMRRIGRSGLHSNPGERHPAR